MKIQGIVTTIVLTLALIIISTTTAAALSCDGGDICVNETGWWRDGGAFNANGTPIQAAVDNAPAGETIFVWNGSYTENVNITTAHLTLAGEGAAAVTVTAANPGDHVFNVTADYVNISGFIVTGATGWGGYAGIYLGSVDHCTISSNNVLINCEGIYLYHSSNNTIIDNNASSSISCGSGILLRSSHSNYIINNNASNNEYPGIYLYASGSNTIADNTLINNTACNYSYGGIDLYFSSSSNTITNNTIIDNLGNGIRIWDSSNSNTITNNTISDNTWDLYIQDSESSFRDNTLSGTTISFTYGGDVSLKGVGSPAADPAGQQTIGKFINATNQSAGAWLFLNFSYSDADVSDPDESNLTVWKHNGAMWLEDGWNKTRYLDTAGNVVGVNITSFSVFAPAVPLETFTPPDPVNLANTSGEYWINYTWSAGTGNATDSYNVSLNGAWTNGTANTFSNTSVGPSGWANVTVFAYNASGAGMQSAGSVSDSVQAPAATLPIVIVLRPDGGEEIPGKSVYDITWNTTAGTYDLAADPINISYSNDSGASWNSIASNEPDDGRYSWSVPNINSSNCTVNVTVRDADGNTGSDVSNSTFTILQTDNSTNETIPAGETATVEGPPESNTTVNVTADGNVTVTVAYYNETPHPGADEPDDMLPKYIDIAFSNNDNVTWPIYVEMHYTDDEVEGMNESSLGLYYYKDGAWHRCSDTGVNVDENYIWANVTADECPGSPFGAGGPDTTPPVITITTPSPYGLYTAGMTLDFSATDDESGVASVVGNLTNTSGVSQDVDSGFEPEVGVYTLVVTAYDNAGNTNVSDPVFFVVYDPDGGHATGGGWFYPDGDSTLPGDEANFGFTARYKNDVSTGKLNFQYNDADLHLKSTSIDWLTISAVSAQFQGTGTINGEGLYTFRVKAKDNGEPGVDVDHFDIKIWEGTDTEADPYHKAKNTISGGNIQVHTK